MRHALRRDSSHRAVADALRLVGAEVLEGFDADLYVRFQNRSWILEVKNRERAQSRRTGGIRKGELREKQKKLKDIFGDQYIVAFDAEGALAAIGAVRG